MAVGTKQGCLCIYGQPGVEMSSSHDSGAAVLQLFFLPGQGRIVALLEDNTLHLWQVRCKGSPCTHQFLILRDLSWIDTTFDITSQRVIFKPK